MENKPKRKYVKRSTMLLRSNNDYIDHTYWPTVRAGSAERHRRIMEKYGARDMRNLNEPAKMTPEAAAYNKRMGIGVIHAVPDVPPTGSIPFMDD